MPPSLSILSLESAFKFLERASRGSPWRPSKCLTVGNRLKRATSFSIQYVRGGEFSISAGFVVGPEHKNVFVEYQAVLYRPRPS